MSVFEKLAPENQQRLETAACWWDRLQKDPSVELTSEFLEWIAEPINARAFRAVEGTMSTLDEFGTTPNILNMRRSALTQLRNAGAIRSLPKWSTYVAAAAVVLLTFGGGLSYYLHADRPLSYQTDVGERRVIALPDGSRISLDSDSEVDIRYSKAARAITLGRGRARFDVAHDVARPFTVTAGAETVVAVGTSFDVERRGSEVLVTLIQGRVLVKQTRSDIVANLTEPPRQLVRVSVGEQLVAFGDQRPTVAVANLDVTQAWEVGHLIFRGELLGDAVQQVNRYTDHPIVVDPSVASIRISGVFNTGDIGSFVSAITGYFPVDATTDANNTITLQRRS
jgi:transmembrane sensor